MVILSISSRSPYRISIATDAVPTTTAADYVVSRPDNGPISIAVSAAYLTAPTSVELVLSDAMADGVVYLLTLPNASGTPSAIVAYRSPAAPGIQPTPGNDPEAEAFGVDMDWLSDSLTGDGDIPQIRGRQCVVNDLTAISFIAPGELYHRPQAGADMTSSVNGPGVPNELGNITSRLKREWSKDGRVRPNGVAVTASTDAAGTGRVNVNGSAQTIAIDDPLIVKIPGWAT